MTLYSDTLHIQIDRLIPGKQDISILFVIHCSLLLNNVGKYHDDNGLCNPW